MSKFKTEPVLKSHQKKLTQKVLIFSSSTTMILAGVSYLILNIQPWVPIILFSFSSLMLLVLYSFLRHENLTKMYYQGSSLIFSTVILTNIFSGGLEGVFNFMIPIIVISGYSMKKKYGRFWFGISLLSILILFFIDTEFIEQINEVSSNQRPFFLLLSMATGIIILGGAYGEYLINLIVKSRLRTKEIAEKNTENELLLKEIHHRVKNNMQVISGLLSLQATESNDPVLKEHFKLSQNRIKTMGIVHEMLYEENDFSSINFHDYLERLISQLIISFKGIDNNINIEIEVTGVSLNIDTAIPIGIIINEIITNSLKHGITDNQSGTISLKVEKLNYPYFILYIGDNGTGLEGEVRMKESSSFGLNLIQNLAKQLKGEAELENSENGTQFILNFQEINKNKQ